MNIYIIKWVRQEYNNMYVKICSSVEDAEEYLAREYPECEAVIEEYPLYGGQDE